MKTFAPRALSRIVIAIGVALLVVACSGSSDSPAGPTRLQTPSATVVTRTSVVEMLGTEDSWPVGLTITPDTEQLVLLDAVQGVFVLDAKRQFQRVITRVQLHEQVTAASEFTDIAALGSNQFAITASNDGFLLDLDDGSLRQHFCYVPGGGFGIPNVTLQHTDSVAFDPLTGRILAQPVTFDPMSGMPINSEVGTFPITGGEGTDWHAIDEIGFLAGAIAVDSGGMLWLARGFTLYQYDLATDTLSLQQSLERFAIREVVGMVFDGGDLVVVDGATREIVCIPAALL